MEKGLQVLLVDDNPVIRDLLLYSLSKEAEVYPVASGSEALRRAGSVVPDLIVSDYRMPAQNGVDFLAQLRQLYPRIAVMLMASRADISGPLSGASPLVEDFIEKPFFVDEAVVKVKRVLDRVRLSKAAREGSSSSVCGTLAQMSVMDLLQTLDIGRKSCRLMLTRPNEQCEMLFHDGQLAHAILGDLRGESAVYKAACWSEGSCQIDFERIECVPSIKHSTQSVLMEALRLFDEAQRDMEATPASA